jgi:hypothetical protein
MLAGETLRLEWAGVARADGERADEDKDDDAKHEERCLRLAIPWAFDPVEH